MWEISDAEPKKPQGLSPWFLPKSVYDLSQTDAVVKVYTASGNEYEYKAPRFFRGYVWDVFEYDCANDMIKTLPVNTKEWWYEKIFCFVLNSFVIFDHQ